MAKKTPPGPTDGFFGMRTMARMVADVLGTYTWLHRDYGDCVSFVTGPFRLYFFFHPDQVREVLVSQSRSFIRFPRPMQTFAQWNGNSILIAEGEQWVRQRRLVQPAFQPRRFEAYGRVMVASSLRLFESWRPSIEREGFVDVDINKAMTSLTLAIICKTLFDTEITDESGELAQAVATLSDVAFHEMQAPIRLPNWWPTRFYRRKRWAIKTLDDTIWRIVRERRAKGTDQADLLSSLLATVDDEGNGGRLTDKQVRDEATTLMLAGHDTTAAALDWLWYCLARSPEAAQKCQAEIDAALAGREPTAADLPCLPYLEAAIRESLRLYPAAIGVFLRQTAADIEIGGYNVPKSSLVALSSYITQRDERWFPEPERFDPERFLPPREGEIKPGSYFPFGAGPRVCIGQAFAMTEMSLVAATLLQRCDVSTVPDAPDTKPQVSLAMRPSDGLKLRWRLR